ncbi:hypothetical protein C1645_819842 [Glomus cerebriforme]|uniref:BTB domain-containing protein n=1 Tax=Glomus cerebriforme TaxID=658196 RepID=A0A397T732_9GLOM|nr:hypothetical protein C1645_819842 [Glomus cerebriforme]
MQKNNHHTTDMQLSSDYKKLFETELGFMLLFMLGKNQIKEIHAHSNILCIRSHYFQTAFSSERAKKENEILIHIYLISFLLDSSYYNRKNVPYEFKLLYHSTKDGFNTVSFKNCDNKGATIWIAKIQDSTQLIGGYDWSGEKYKCTTDSFLCNFTDGKNISTALLKRINVNAICCANNEDHKWVIYIVLIPTIVEEYEVFQVIKNNKNIRKRLNN